MRGPRGLQPPAGSRPPLRCPLSRLLRSGSPRARRGRMGGAGEGKPRPSPSTTEGYSLSLSLFNISSFWNILSGSVGAARRCLSKRHLFQCFTDPPSPPSPPPPRSTLEHGLVAGLLEPAFGGGGARSPRARRCLGPGRGRSRAPPGSRVCASRAPGARCVGGFLFTRSRVHWRLLANGTRSGSPRHSRPFRVEGRRGSERRRGMHTPSSVSPMRRGPRRSRPGVGRERGAPPTYTLTPYQYKSLTRALLQVVMTSQSCCRSRKHASHSHRSILHPRKVT